MRWLMQCQKIQDGDLKQIDFILYVNSVRGHPLQEQNWDWSTVFKPTDLKMCDLHSWEGVFENFVHE